MKRAARWCHACSLAVCASTTAADADPRLRDVVYDPRAVVTIPVKRGIVTLVVLAEDESIVEVAAGLGGDCARPEAAWCVAAQAGGRTLFVKPKSMAAAPNNLAVVTDRRSHLFRFVVLPDDDAKPPVFRLVVRPPARPASAAAEPLKATASATPLLAATAISLPTLPTLPPEQVVAERLLAKPEVLNSKYSIAEGAGSQDIVPTLVFDDGRMTYLRFSGNGALPAVFEVLGDGSEALVNTRMEDELLVVDRVSRRLMLRAGAAVVGVWNDDFDIEGRPATNGTTVPGIGRVLQKGGLR
jgi:type IV secretion system protein VirB9